MQVADKIIMRPVEALIAYTRSCRASSIAVTTWPEEATRTANSGCVWIAVATVEGGIYTARSRHGVANELARQLVAAGDLPPP